MTVTHSLFDIGKDLLEIHASLVEAEGELNPELEARLQSATEALADRVDAYGWKLRSLKARAETHKEREQFHAAQRRAYERLEEHLKQRLLEVMGSLQTRRLAGEDFVASVRESESVQLLDPNKVPEGFIRVEVHYDREAIKRVLREGREVPGAMLERRLHVQIR